MSVNLLFRGAPYTDPPIDLVLGDTSAGGVIEDAIVSGAVALPGITVTSTVRLGFRVGGTIALAPAAIAASNIKYATNTQRPMVADVDVRWQDSESQSEIAATRWQDTDRAPAHAEERWQDAQRFFEQSEIAWHEADRTKRESLRARHQDTLRQHTGAEQLFMDAIRAYRPAPWVRFQDGVGTHDGLEQHFQDGIRGTAGQQHVRYQDARRQPVRAWAPSSYGRSINRGWKTRYQEGMQPRPGITDFTPPEPPENTCYVANGHLVYKMPWSAETHLIFICDGHDETPEPGDTVIVPIRRVYMVLNNASLRRVDGNIHIPTFGMSMSLDTDTFTWGFDAEVPVSEEAHLEPSSFGDPVELEIKVNGVPYRVMVETMQRTREFARASTHIGGRGKSALLDAPYAPVMSFGNINARTAQQLMGDVLTYNGGAIGWDVDWGLSDWLVPAGVFSHQGSYITALDAIAKAAGGFLQPSAVAQTLRVLPRYASLPRDWADVTPDFELPADVTTREGIEWTEKPNYNRVYVSGSAGGRLGIATLVGTAGDLVAPQIVDPLITHADASRQRAMQVFGDTGRQAALSLRLPVLEETGIITPGKFIRYVDGGVTRLGVVRKVGVDIGTPEIWQTLGVETHVLPA